MVAVLAIFRYHASYVGAGHGRYLYPVLAPLMVFAARGLVEWRLRWKVRLLPVVAAGLGSLSLATFPLSLAPVYPPPQMVAPEQVAASAAPLEVTFSEGIRLAAYLLETPSAQAGEGARSRARLVSLAVSDEPAWLRAWQDFSAP